MGASTLYSSNKCLLALIAAWVGLGLFGHDPWKPDEAYTFGLVYHAVQTGEWLVPTLAGEPFMEKPPLFFITAAVFAKLAGWLLPLHDAARLACAFYVFLTLYFIAKTARSLHAPLLLIACLGYVHHAHLLITDNSLVAGVAIGLYGLAISVSRPQTGGALLGTGAGIAFLSKGLLGPGMLGLTALALLAFPAWRRRNYFQSCLWAALAFAPWALIWPWLLYRHSPQLFHEWFWVNNLGRFTGQARLGGVADQLHYLKALPWFALPAWPLAAWTLWIGRRSLLREPKLQLPLVAFLVMFVVLSASSAARQIYALPMLLPLCVLAAASLDSLPAWISRPLDVFARWGAGVAALALWAGWLAVLVGWLSLVDAPGFVPRADPLLLILAAAVTLGCAFLFRRKFDLPVHWAAGITLVWGLAMTLWLPYLDYTKTYRGMIADMQRGRPAAGECVISRDLGEPQRAMFHYFAGILSVAGESSAELRCGLLLVQTSRDAEPQQGAHWKLVWRGTRPGDDKEWFWLFSRAASR